MPVIRVPTAVAALPAADLLLRSAGFGVVVVDLGVPPAIRSTALARLAGLARRHQTAVLFLTRTPAAACQPFSAWRTPSSMGSLISVHVSAQHRRIDSDRFHCEIVALKDKHLGPAWRYAEVRHGAPGLR
jgi:recombination protein RecA